LRLELGASRQLAVALAAIGTLGAVGTFLTDLPLTGAAALSAVCIGWGGYLARNASRREPVRLVLRGDGGITVDGMAVDDAKIHWQGPLTCLQWRVGARRERFVAWPDVVDAAARRELRLWALAHRAHASTAPVAP
jgi:toxin CptA